MRISATMVRIKGIKRYRSKGQWYCYHRASGTRLVALFGTPAFIAELATVEEEWKRKGGVEIIPGSLGHAIVLYKKSPAFMDLAARTQSDYQKVFDYLQPLGEMPLVKIDSAFVAKLRDRTYEQRRRRFANYVVSVLGSIFAHAKEYGLVDSNPAKGVKPVKRPKDLPKANRPWTAAEQEIVLETAPAHLKTGIALGMFTGMREGDVIRLPRNARGEDGWLCWKSGKAGTDVEWPVHSRLAEILEQTAPDAVTNQLQGTPVAQRELLPVSILQAHQ
jgi:integrase